MIIIKNITQFIFLTTATVQLTSIHGVSEKDLHVYKKDKLTCPSTGKQLSASMINDGVCDCPDDGFDEPGTAACQAGHFYCKNSHNLELIIDSFKVNDGVCDCCDGSDEYLNLFDKKCPNSCGQLRRDLRRTAYLDMVKIKKARVYYEKNKIEALIMREELKLNLDEITSKLKYAQPEEAKADNTDRPNIDQLDHLITNQRSTSEKTQSIWRHLIDTKLKRAKQFISLMATGSNTPMTENVKNNPSTIVTTADSSKNSYYEDSDEKDELMENMKDIENILNNPELYGPDSVFLPLKGRCFEAENAGFSYSLCWFDEIRQSNGNSIGIWNGKWRENGENRIDYTNMFYNDGNWCGSKARETQVSLKCGWSDQIVSVEEPSKCFYLIEFSTPIACIL